MDRAERLERTLFGVPAENRPGALERLNTTERIAAGIQTRLNQLAWGIIGLVIASVLQLVLAKHSAAKLENLPKTEQSP